MDDSYERGASWLDKEADRRMGGVSPLRPSRTRVSRARKQRFSSTLARPTSFSMRTTIHTPE